MVKLVAFLTILATKGYTPSFKWVKKVSNESHNSIYVSPYQTEYPVYSSYHRFCLGIMEVCYIFLPIVQSLDMGFRHIRRVSSLPQWVSVFSDRTGIINVRLPSLLVYVVTKCFENLFHSKLTIRCIFLCIFFKWTIYLSTIMKVAKISGFLITS